ncbi:MAG: hypothetical protein WAK48_00155 [Candidatus Acidiferrum sp.]|jgi:hypothetical protein
MKRFALASVFAVCFLLPLSACAQNTGRIDCPRNDRADYVYLYSSIATMEIRSTLDCGAVVTITGRFDNFFAVRTAKGETGFVPLGKVIVLTDQVGPTAPTPSGPPARERMYYDETLRGVPATTAANPTVAPFILLNDTTIHLKLTKSISSNTAHVNDPVEFETLDDILIQGVAIIRKGSNVTGVIVDAEPKRHFGHGGKLAFNITTIRLANGEVAPVRCYQQFQGSSNNSSESVVPLYTGKDTEIPKDSTFTAFVDGDVHLTRETFAATKDGSSSNSPESLAHSTQP